MAVRFFSPFSFSTRDSSVLFASGFDRYRVRIFCGSHERSVSSGSAGGEPGAERGLSERGARVRRPVRARTRQKRAPRCEGEGQGEGALTYGDVAGHVGLDHPEG